MQVGKVFAIFKNRLIIRGPWLVLYWPEYYTNFWKFVNETMYYCMFWYHCVYWNTSDLLRNHKFDTVNMMAQAFPVLALGDSQALLTCIWLSPARCLRNHTAPLLSLLLSKHKPYTTTVCRAGSRPHSRISAYLKFLVLTLFGVEPTNFLNLMAAAHLKLLETRRCSYET